MRQARTDLEGCERKILAIVEVIAIDGRSHHAGAKAALDSVAALLRRA